MAGVRIRPTPTGIAYAAIAAASLGASYVHHVNLLTLFFAALTAPALLGAWWARRQTKRLSARRLLPGEAFAGAACIAEIEIANAGRFAARGFEVRDVWKPDADIPAVPAPTIPGRGAVGVRMRVVPRRRGPHELSPLRISTRMPLGLFEATRTLSTPNTLTVYPALGRMNEQWRRAAGLAGGHDARGGAATEHPEAFRGVRDFQPGDTLRHIHWRSTARRGKPVVKEFDAPQADDAALFVVPAGDAGEDLEAALSFAATAAAEYCRAGAARGTRLVFGLATRGAPTTIAGAVSAATLRSVWTALALAEPVPAEAWKTGLPEWRRGLRRAGCIWVVAPRPLPGFAAVCRRDLGVAPILVDSAAARARWFAPA